jgi:hypothetical protein
MVAMIFLIVKERAKLFLDRYLKSLESFKETKDMRRESYFEVGYLPFILIIKEFK